MQSYLIGIENFSLPKLFLDPSRYSPALFTMMSTQHNISLANIEHRVGARVGEVITQPIMKAVPELNRKVELLLQASFKLEEISGHLICKLWITLS